MEHAILQITDLDKLSRLKALSWLSPAELVIRQGRQLIVCADKIGHSQNSLTPTSPKEQILIISDTTADDRAENLSRRAGVPLSLKWRMT